MGFPPTWQFLLHQCFCPTGRFPFKEQLMLEPRPDPATEGTMALGRGRRVSGKQTSCAFHLPLTDLPPGTHSGCVLVSSGLMLSPNRLPVGLCSWLFFPWQVIQGPMRTLTHGEDGCFCLVVSRNCSGAEGLMMPPLF